MLAKPKLSTELALLLMLSSLWGASYTFIKIGVETIPPVTLIAARTLIAGLVLALILRWRGVRWPRDRATWARFTVQACLNSVVPFTLIAWAETAIDASLAVILNAMTPIFTFLLTAFVTRHEAITARKGFGVAAGLMGASLIVGFEAFGGLGKNLWPQLAIVAATISYAGAAIFGKSFRDFDPMVPAASSLVTGAVLLLPLCIMIDRPWTLAPSGRSLMALVALAVVSTALAFSIYFRLIQTLGSVGATAQAYLRVPVGMAIGMVFLDEQPQPAVWFGLAFVMAGVIAMTLPARMSLRVKAL
ncbi:DMT family transporter [Allorhizobium borbori]|uniref:Drug/metabolite transporter (DMT)-like permease n=1 Tax=Allorhizobium borbori TaxID=485907 RepID=A0A7W6K3X9_9HYPH|nr:EamA family transporter [Allorhizobium borbori]MBB4104763.1 drug/metabolite transporter (DMT)-like permease [Allorhizobium borbori]